MWVEVFKCWGVENLLHGCSISNIWSWQSVFGRSVMRVCWNSSIAANLWLIWLAMNQIIFERKSIKLEELIYLIKIRVLKWCSAAGMCDDVRSSSWLISPECSIMQKYKTNLKSLFVRDFDLFYFTDGAFHCNSTAMIKARIGGYIKDKDGTILYIFSGPADVNCPLRAEIEAVTFIVNVISSSKFKASKIKISSDC